MIRETFQTPGHVVLDVRIPEGDIDLETVDGETTDVELDFSGDPELVRELEADARVDLRESASGFEVRVEVEQRRRFRLDFWRGSDIRLTARLPHGADVRIDTGSADTRGRGRFGAVEVRSGSGDVDLAETAAATVKAASGDVTLRRVEGDALITTASGDVELERVGGETVVRTASGDVALRDPGSGITVQTASGDQQIDAVAEGSVTLQSASGDIHVGIRRGSSLWVDARALSGSTTSELELEDAPPEGEGPLVELRATSMSGDIRVVRAPARSELPQ
jgi:hypothetical protein